MVTDSHVKMPYFICITCVYYCIFLQMYGKYLTQYYFNCNLKEKLWDILNYDLFMNIDHQRRKILSCKYLVKSVQIFCWCSIFFSNFFHWYFKYGLFDLNIYNGFTVWLVLYHKQNFKFKGSTNINQIDPWGYVKEFCPPHIPYCILQLITIWVITQYNF